MLWYALQTKQRFERTVSVHLQNEGYEQYLPTYRSRRAWSDRIKEIDLPLFPGYIFCKFDFSQRLPILVIPGVMSVVTFGGGSCSISEQEVLAVQNVARSGLPYGPWPFTQVGQPVRVKRGPLQGLEGVLAEVKNNCRLIISVSLLQRCVSVEIDQECVAPIFNGNGMRHSRAV
jgi:transcription antitermination factor NusG